MAIRNKVLERPLPNASLPRNAFDRGFDIKYNFSSGMALPVFCEPVLGKTKMRINRRCMIRASQLQTAAMVRNSFNIDFFFVPFRQLWSYYGISRTGTKDYYSSKLAPTQDVSVIDLPSFKASDGTIPHDLYVMVDSLRSTSDTQNNPDIHGYAPHYGCLRLLDLLDYGINVEYDSTSVSLQQKMNTLPSLCMFKLLAYQKVWYDHYRISNYIKNEPKAYNVDGLLNNSGGLVSPDSDWLMKIGTMHYVPYRKDYFQNIYPSLNYAPSNQMGSSYFAVPNNVVGAQLGATFSTSSGSGSITTQILGNSSGVSQYTSDVISMPLVNAKSSNFGAYGVTFTAQTVRALFALDKMTRLAAYAPKHVSDQFEARFGFRPKGEDFNESVRIGSFVSDISIGEVVSTAETNSGYEGSEKTTQLGAIGGRAFSVSNFEKDIEYESPEDGLIIGIAYALPRLAYDAGGIDAFNMILSSTQLPQPEFMDLGLQPLRQNEFYHLSSNDSGIDSLNNRILGYQPMYSSWKIGKSRNHGKFIRGQVLSVFSTHTRSDYVLNYSLVGTDGVSANYFYATPNDLDSIFAQYYDGSQDTDQFFGQIDFKFDVVQNFSIHGQPRI